MSVPGLDVFVGRGVGLRELKREITREDLLRIE